jgi:hypothetical protein
MPVDLHPYLALPIEKASKVIRGIELGHYYQDGGVIREEGTQRFVAFLRATDGLRESANSTVQILTGISAAASVINVGVSVVGFAVMNQKLNRLQQGMQALQASVDGGFSTVSSQLDEIARRAACLELLATRSLDELEGARREIRRTSLQLDIAQFAPLAAAIENLEELRLRKAAPVRDRVEAQIDRAQGVRSFCAGMVAQLDFAVRSPFEPLFVASLNYLSVGVLAVVVEARALRMLDETVSAAARLRAAEASFFPPTRVAIRHLLAGDEMCLAAAEIGRFATPFERATIAGFVAEASPSQAMDSARSRWIAASASMAPAARAVVRTLREQGEAWEARIGVSSRLASTMNNLRALRAEYELCAREHLPEQSWEGMALTGGESGLYAIVPTEL